jgi:hypothetical protein
MGTRGSFPGGKAQPGPDADHSPPSSAEGKKEYELYLLLPKNAPMEHNQTTFYKTLHTHNSIFILLSTIFKIFVFFTCDC